MNTSSQNRLIRWFLKYSVILVNFEYQPDEEGEIERNTSSAVIFKCRAELNNNLYRVNITNQIALYVC